MVEGAGFTAAVAIGVFFGFVFAGVGAARAESAEVESLIAQGNDLRQQGQPDRALPFFQKAYALARTPRTEGQLGLAEMAAGYPVEAEEHLLAALDSRENPWVSKNRAGLQKTLALARSRIGELAVDGGPPGAAVAVNGRPVGVLPLPAPVRLAAGRIELEVSAPGYSTATRVMHLAASQHQQISVTLTKSTVETAPNAAAATALGASTAPIDHPAPSPLAPASGLVAEPSPTVGPVGVGPPAAASSEEIVHSNSASPPTSGVRVGAWSLAPVAVIATAAGLGLQLSARSKLSSFNGSCEVDGGIPQAKASSIGATDDQTCTNLYDSWKGERTWSVVGYAVGAAAAVTSGVLFWTSRSRGPDAALHARFTCTPAPNRFLCRGEF